MVPKTEPLSAVFYDSETHPIKPGLQAPPVVLTQWAEGEKLTLRGWEAGLRYLRQVLRNPSVLLVGHHIAYDMCAAAATCPDLLNDIFEAYAQDRITCTVLRDKLLAIASTRSLESFRFNLIATLDRHKIPHAFTKEDKAGGVRLRYADWKDLPPEQLPPEARRYALEDVRHGLRLYQSQADQGAARGVMRDEFRQARASFVLSLISSAGLRVDQAFVEDFSEQVEIEAEVLRKRLEAGGLLVMGTLKKQPAKDRMLETCAAIGIPVRITKTGKEKIKAKEMDRAGAIAAGYISCDAEACEASQDQLLIDYARFGSLRTLRSRVKRLRMAGNLPIQTSFDVLKETGRTSSRTGAVDPGKHILAYGDQVQNMNRAPGLRECYRARDGHVYVAVDWSAAELSTLAEACEALGIPSQLGAVIRSGKDPHLAFGAAMNGWTYEWALANRKLKEVKDARQAAKAANFGFPGGLGVTTFRIWASVTYGVHLSKAQATALRKAWFAWYPEMKAYFDHVNAMLSTKEPLRQIRSGRLRGGVYYTNACNSYFQGLAADMAKDAGFDLAREMYTDRTSVLYGCRIVNFIHDEYIVEAPQEKAHLVAARVVEIMEAAGRKWAPTAPPAAEPSISYRWRKGAEPVYRNGILIPWEDRDLDGEMAKGLTGDYVPFIVALREHFEDTPNPIRQGVRFGIEPSRVTELLAA